MLRHGSPLNTTQGAVCVPDGSRGLYLSLLCFLQTPAANLGGIGFLASQNRTFRDLSELLEAGPTGKPTCQRARHQTTVPCAGALGAGPAPSSALLGSHPSLLTGSSAAPSPSLSHKHAWAICVLKTGEDMSALPLPRVPLTFLRKIHKRTDCGSSMGRFHVSRSCMVHRSHPNAAEVV